MSNARRTWHKSSYSNGSGNGNGNGNGGQCVEVSEGRTTNVRDTRNRSLSELSMPASEWSALLSALRTD
ncbi:DUF397 domain-containing protein [Nocardiopsis alba]|uniref:DUF397 domain-containing protein n=1 Tax=Nocardiopsis alba TaxID=53437 RepID=UPI0033B03A52